MLSESTENCSLIILDIQYSHLYQETVLLINQETIPTIIKMDLDALENKNRILYEKSFLFHIRFPFLFYRNAKQKVLSDRDIINTINLCNT